MTLRLPAITPELFRSVPRAPLNRFTRLPSERAARLTLLGCDTDLRRPNIQRAAMLLRPGETIRRLELTRDRIAEIEANRRSQLYNEIAKLREQFIVLLADETCWLEFCRRPQWQKFSSRAKPKIGEHTAETVAHFVAHVVCSEKRDHSRSRRSKWKAALLELFERDIPPKRVVRCLKQNKGIRGLAEAWQHRRASDRLQVAAPSLESAASLTAEKPTSKISKKPGLAERVPPVSKAGRNRGEKQYEPVALRLNKIGRELINGERKRRTQLTVSFYPGSNGKNSKIVLTKV